MIIGLETGQISGENLQETLQAIDRICRQIENLNIEKAGIFCVREERMDKIKEILRLEHLNPEEYESLMRSINANQDIFYVPGDPLPGTHIMKHKINLTSNMPVNVKQFRLPSCHREEVDRQIKELLELDVIQPFMSPYDNPVFVMLKKRDKDGKMLWRCVLDFRKLNDVTIPDSYPLHLINEILDQLGNAKYFTMLNLFSGFHQIFLEEEDTPKTAFNTPNSHFEFKRLAFGLTNAPRTFQRLMDIVLSGLIGTSCYVYLDGTVIYAETLEEHERKLNEVIARLCSARLKLQCDKCEFLKNEVTYLGHVISSNGVSPNPKKLQAVRDFPVPKDVRNVQQFLGLCNYYRRFKKIFAEITKPLTVLLNKHKEAEGKKGKFIFEWGEAQEKDFELLKNLLTEAPLLAYPDFSKPFNLTTDASGYGLGAVLSQGEIGKNRPIAYASRTLNDRERDYDTTDKEAAAMTFAEKQFRPYIYGTNFKLITDHRALCWIKTKKDPNARVTRWRLRLSEYDYEIIFKPGSQNLNADALSGNPIEAEVKMTHRTRARCRDGQGN